MKRNHKKKRNSIYTDGSYADAHPEMHVPDSEWKANNSIKILRENNLKPKKICEVGCGAGEILNVMHDKLPKETNFYGYEISPEAFAMCKEREKDRLTFFLSDFLKEETFYDLLLCMDVFEHVDDYIGFLRELKNKSKYKIFHIPLDMNINYVFREKPLIRERNYNGHLHYFNKYTAIETLLYSGYNIIDSFYTKLPNSGTKLNRIFEIPRRALFKINKDLCVKLMGGYSLMVLTE